MPNFACSTSGHSYGYIKLSGIKWNKIMIHNTVLADLDLTGLYFEDYEIFCQTLLLELFMLSVVVFGH